MVQSVSHTISSAHGRIRPLYDWEVAEAHCVFGDQPFYGRVRIHEGVTWPDILDRLGRWLKCLPPLPEGQHNAITLGYHCYFPVQMPEAQPTGADRIWAMGWLVHELTHAWQYQRLGWRTMWLALVAQFREGRNIYDYGGAEELVRKRAVGWTVHDFNLEQQGAIAEAFYCRQCTCEDVQAWLPYIQDIKGYI